MSSGEQNPQGEGESPPPVSVAEDYRLQHRREIYQLRKAQWQSFVDDMKWRPSEFEQPNFMTKPEWKLVMRAWETARSHSMQAFDPERNCSFATREYVQYVRKLYELAKRLESDWDAFYDGDDQTDEAENQLRQRLAQTRYNSKRLRAYLEQFVPDRDLMWLKGLPRSYLLEKHFEFVDVRQLNERGDDYNKSLVRNFVDVMVELYNPD